MTIDQTEINAQGSIKRAKSISQPPYDAWDGLWYEERAALAIMCDILDRRSIKWVFENLDEDAKQDILTTWALIIEYIWSSDELNPDIRENRT